jgi:hypothetical protein
MQPHCLDMDKDGESATFSRRNVVGVAAGAAVAVGPKLTYAAPEIRRLNVNSGVAFAASGVVSSSGAQTGSLTGVLFSSTGGGPNNSADASGDPNNTAIVGGDPNNTAMVGGEWVTNLPDTGVGAPAN